MKLLALSIATIALLSSCNTTIGLGRDLRLLGGGIEKQAEGSGRANTGGAPVY